MDNPWKSLSTINPQREEGHREISNGVYSALLRADLTGGELQIALAIIEKTWGFNKKSDRISRTQFSELTGLSERSVNVIIKSLKEKRIIYYEPSRVKRGSSLSCGSPLNEFIFNKHYDTWLRVKRGSGMKQTVNKGEVNGILGVKRSSPTKETITKEKTKEKKPLPLCPGFISPEVWSDFVEHRKTTRPPSPLSAKAAELIFKKLGTWEKENGWSPDEILNQSIENGWKGVFELKNKGNGGFYGGDAYARAEKEADNWLKSHQRKEMETHGNEGSSH
jgi:phage replication O-like protein O